MKQKLFVLGLLSLVLLGGFLVTSRNILTTQAQSTNTNVNWSLPFAFHVGYNCSGSCTPATDMSVEYPMDLNGDGLVDVITTVGSAYAPAKAYMNQGNGTWTIRDVPGFGSINREAIHFPDLNGDGLVDILAIRAASTTNNMYSYNYLNNGTNWPTSNSWAMPAGLNYKYRNGLNFMDINSDGLSDLVLSYYVNATSDYQGETLKEIYLNTGSSWSLAYHYKQVCTTTNNCHLE